MPRIKHRSIPETEDKIKKALPGLQKGTFKSLQQAATHYEIPKRTLASRKNGRKSRQEAHAGLQIFNPVAERAIV
ncbi:hypothetical protein K440DRAFT_570167 [Wilcoxina mikolae CBS 423.85]|nr:hypothetical protein K440DRAFT_570167 [Wilcoxina mikolae CBS 423.85]